tara:strand:+ start:234 stop:437 length:204 start_codon:yes stop_codon:yes gene_type:complete
MISAFFTGVVVAIPTSILAMKLLNSSLFIDNQELRNINEKISIVINQIDDFREERLAEKEEVSSNAD